MKKSMDVSRLALLKRKIFKLSLPLRQMTAGSRKTADIIIVGAQKAGTTYLFSLLAKSEGFYGPPVKEVHYFDVSYGKGPAWYAAHFEPKTSSNMQVDASPFYMFHPDVPQRIAGLCPDVKIIAVLRDPVERAYSHFHHNIRNGRETLDFQAALDAEADRIGPQMEALKTDPNAKTDQYRHFSYIERGKYSDQVAQLYAAFPKEQVHLVDSALMFAHDADEMAALETFIGRPFAKKPSSGIRKNAGQYPGLDAETVARLKDKFAPYDAELADMSSRNWSWMAQ